MPNIAQILSQLSNEPRTPTLIPEGEGKKDSEQSGTQQQIINSSGEKGDVEDVVSSKLSGSDHIQQQQ